MTVGPSLMDNEPYMKLYHKQKWLPWNLVIFVWAIIGQNI